MTIFKFRILIKCEIVKSAVLIRVHGDTFFLSVTTQLFRTSYFIGPGYHAALLFLESGSIYLLSALLFSQLIREDLVTAAYCPSRKPFRAANFGHFQLSLPYDAFSSIICYFLLPRGDV